MYKNAFCPISDNRVNSAVVRTHALINVAILVAFLVTQNFYIALFLLADFVVRVFNFPNLSLVGLASKTIVKTLSIKGHLENAGPKVFAARIGLLLSALILASLLLSNITLAISTAAVLVFFSFLEGAFGICVACIIYPWVYRLVYRSRNAISGSSS